VTADAKGIALKIASLEPAAVILAAPLLAFPTLRPGWTTLALVALLAVWLLRWFGDGRPGARTPLDVSLLLLAATIPVGVWASACPEWTLPKLTGLILGLAAFRATVNAARTPRHLAAATALYLLLGLGLALVGLAAVGQVTKLPVLGGLLARVPRLIQGLPGAGQGVHPNELGGALVLFLPVSLAAAWGWDMGGRQATRAARLAAATLSLFLAAVLLLSQSRSAWYGALAGLAAMAWLRWRRARWLVLAGGLILFLGLLYAGPANQGAFLDTASLAERAPGWARGLDALRAFPLTGCGLGTFRQVAHLFGPLPLAAPEPYDLAHAHNVFLQVALDLGLPGLVGYLAVVGGALWCAWRVARMACAPFAWLAPGIAGSLVAFQAYGLADTVALGAKPGLAFWLLLALAAVLWTTATEVPQERGP